MADGIVFERVGVQAASIVTDAFVQSSDAMARLQGAPGYRYAMIPHPVSNLSPEECHERAAAVLPQVLEILGLDQTEAAPGQVGSTEDDGDQASVLEPADLPTDRVEDVYRLARYYQERGWTDGLPVLPVTEAVVDEFCAYVGRDPREEVVSTAALERVCTVRLAAAAAAMAGCRKEYFPIVLAAAEAMQPSVSTGLLQSTTGQSQLLIVNGPIRGQLGFNGAGNVFGPGFQANASVGRAIRLIVMNAFGIRPRAFDQATQGTPAKYSFCIAENEEDSPWEPLHVERGFAAESNVVTIHFARSTLHIENRSSNKGEEVLLTIADSMSYAGSYMAGRGYTVVMGPEHAALLARQGWSKSDAKRFLWEHWGRRAGDLRRMGLLPQAAQGKEGPADDELLRFGQSPDSILLVVAGAGNAGISTVIPTVAPMFHSKQIDPPARSAGR
ncbi:MAG: hypothetical protein J2O39_06200 [Acidimicrobiales bacterium]|nr:hypothetical protein [Acidimicrobiales bacterium]MBO0886832.1 hypothetical protein [Acidimicrobiales bacterium]MBO0893948.1 hypothetical protein [Acidimicrobiales bacterium]